MQTSRKPLERSSIEAYLAIVISIVTVVVPMSWVLQLFLAIVVACLAADFSFNSPFTIHNIFAIKLMICFVALSLLTLLFYGPIKDSYRKEYQSEITGKVGINPDVALRFVYSKSPAVILVNKSQVVVRNIKYMILLWDMDISDRDNQLPVPVGEFDWIKPNEQSMPIGFFNTGLIAPLLKPGDRLVGSAWVSCAECKTSKGYFVSIIFGKGGWYTEQNWSPEITGYRPRSQSKNDIKDYYDFIEKVPIQLRIPIEGDFGMVSIRP